MTKTALTRCYKITSATSIGKTPSASPPSDHIINLVNSHMDIDESLNVFEEPLQSCSEDPVTGFFRDGCCNTSATDAGSHTVCVKLTQDFLDYSRSQGNDLTTPVPQFNFPGLKEGDHWCLCAARWKEAHEAQCAPRVYLQSTHKRALEQIPIETLRAYAVDLN